MASNDITHALTLRTDLAPRARQVLAAQLAECLALVEPILDGSLDDLQALRASDRRLHGLAIELAIGLRTGALNRGPFERLSRRNWIPAASATRPIKPSSASISRTR